MKDMNALEEMILLIDKKNSNSFSVLDTDV
jgi:hypothetical protein